MLPGTGQSSDRPSAVSAPPAAEPDLSQRVERAPRASTGEWISRLVFLAGLAALFGPTILFVAREGWSTEQGGHGPIVLVTALWLIWSRLPEAKPYVAPPPAWRPALILPVLLTAYAATRVMQIVEVEGYVMYAALVAAFYAVVGGPALRRLAFPLFYFAFVFPPPDTVVYALTLPMKVAISESAVWLLSSLGYPIGSTGVQIQIGQYQLLVAAACSGLNSIISLSVLTTFYIYVLHRGRGMYPLLLLLFVLPVAIMANFARVLILIMLTYYGGEAMTQGFLHNFAGITTFAAALILIFAIDQILGRLFRKRNLPGDGQSARPAGSLK